MKSATTGAISGCLVWVIACGVLSMCILPVSTAIGGITSASDFAINFTGRFICPDGTMPESYSYATTTRDENGNPQPSTAYELHECQRRDREERPGGLCLPTGSGSLLALA